MRDQKTHFLYKFSHKVINRISAIIILILIVCTSNIYADLESSFSIIPDDIDAMGYADIQAFITDDLINLMRNDENFALMEQELALLGTSPQEAVDNAVMWVRLPEDLSNPEDIEFSIVVHFTEEFWAVIDNQLDQMFGRGSGFYIERVEEEYSAHLRVMGAIDLFINVFTVPGYVLVGSSREIIDEQAALINGEIESNVSANTGLMQLVSMVRDSDIGFLVMDIDLQQMMSENQGQGNQLGGIGMGAAMAVESFLLSFNSGADGDYLLTLSIITNSSQSASSMNTMLQFFLMMQQPSNDLERIALSSISTSVQGNQINISVGITEDLLEMILSR